MRINRIIWLSGLWIAAWLMLAGVARGDFAPDEPAADVSGAARSVAPAESRRRSLQPRGHKPRLYLLAIGVSSYPRPDLRLHYAAKDARDLAALFSAQQGELYSAVDSRILTDQDATKANILDGLEWLQRETTNADVALLFLAGHGITESSTGIYQFLPYDADPSAVKRTMVPDYELRESLGRIQGKVIFMVDTCRAGKVFGRTQTRGLGDINDLVRELHRAPNGIIVFAASTAQQASLEDLSWENGAFTKASLEALRGRADEQHEGHVTITMLERYVCRRVKALTGSRQQPTISIPTSMPDIPIAIVREIINEDIAPLR